MATVEEQLQSLVLSASEVSDLTGWPDAMVEDYLNIIRNLIIIASGTDVNNDQIEQNTLDIASNLVLINTNITNIASNLGLINTNITSIGNNATDITTNQTNIGLNTTAIGDNTTDIGDNETTMNDHISADSAHGASGDVIGNTDLATLTLTGVVKQADTVADSTDVTDVAVQFNLLLAKLRTSGALKV